MRFWDKGDATGEWTALKVFKVHHPRSDESLSNLTESLIMSTIRIIPATDDASFPYSAALHALQELPDVVQEETDIPAIIHAGKRIGWPQKVIDEHFGYLERGQCFDFCVENGISCTLWEDNIFFQFFDADHERFCLPQITDLAKRLDCRMLHQ